LAGTWAYSQTKPNYSGTWRLNVAESDFGDKRIALPDSLVWTLQQRTGHLRYTVERARQGKKSSFTYHGPENAKNQSDVNFKRVFDKQ
jgi:hypothetical protein